MWTCAYVCIHKSICACECVHECAYVNVCACMYTWVCMCVWVCVYAYRGNVGGRDVYPKKRCNENKFLFYFIYFYYHDIWCFTVCLGSQLLEFGRILFSTFWFLLRSLTCLGPASSCETCFTLEALEPSSVLVRLKFCLESSAEIVSMSYSLGPFHPETYFLLFWEAVFLFSSSFLKYDFSLLTAWHCYLLEAGLLQFSFYCFFPPFSIFP